MTDRVVLAADLGGTHMRAALVDEQGTVLVRQLAATPGNRDVPLALVELIKGVAGVRGWEAGVWPRLDDGTSNTASLYVLSKQGRPSDC